MKLLDIVINSLRAMGDNFDDDFMLGATYSDIAEDDRYRDRVINMLPVINRALMRAYQLNHFLPKVIDSIEITVGSLIDLSKIKDYGEIIGVYSENGEPITYQRMGNFIIAAAADKLVYMPFVQISLSGDYDWDEPIEQFGVSEILANAIPLYVKYELFQQDDFNISKTAKDDYDSIISKPLAAKPQVTGQQSQVKLIYSCNG